MYTNRNSKKDFVVNGLNKLSSPICNVSIATAFFTDSSFIKRIIEKGCKTRIVVRLGFPTSPSALREIIKLDGCMVRYVSSSSFHPKFYIFGENGAIVGSANLTHSALYTNQEVSLEVSPQDERFDELKKLFEEYWMQASVLTDEVIEKYDKVISNYDKSVFNKLDEINSEVEDNVGKITIDNITREKKKKSKEEVFSEDYRKSYQETVDAFNDLKKIYIGSGPRKVKDGEFPLRLEIDSFISYVRNKHVPGDSYLDEPLRVGDEQKAFIEDLVNEWRDADYKWLDEHIIPETYPRFKKVFSTSKSLLESTDDEFYSSLVTCHAFENRLRFYKGGAPTQKKVFFEENEIPEVKDILNYLVFSNEDIIQKMATCIFHPEYHIAGFGRSCIQELIGWVGDKDLPVINGRTTKVLRYLGYDVKQIS